MDLIDEAKKILILANKTERYFLLNEDSFIKDNRMNVDKDELQKELTKLLFRLLNFNQDPIMFPAELFMNKDQRNVLFPHPRFVQVGKHYHGFIEMIIVIRGKFIHHIGDKIITMKKGDICLLHPNTVHSIEKAKKDDLIINILITRYNYNYIKNLLGWKNNIISIFFNECFFYQKNSIDYLIINDCLHGNTKTTIYNIFLHNNCPNKYFDIQLEKMLETLLIDLAQFCETEFNYKLPVFTESSEKYNKIVTCIENFIPDVTLDKIAINTKYGKKEIDSIIKSKNYSDINELIKDIAFKSIFIAYRNGQSLDMIAKKYNYLNENQILNEFKQLFIMRKLNLKNINNIINDDNEKIDIIIELSTFYDELFRSQVSDNVNKALNSLLNKISFVTKDNIFSFQLICIDVCNSLMQYIEKFNDNMTDNMGLLSPSEEKTKMVNMINSAKSSEEIISYVNEYFVNLTKNKYDQIKSYNPIVNNALKIIKEKYLLNITLSEIATAIVVNPSYLSRLIKSETGKKFSEIVNSYKIEESKKLLANTSQPIATIAEKSGFTGYTYFYQVFVKTVGITPKEYRNHNIYLKE